MTCRSRGHRIFCKCCRCSVKRPVVKRECCRYRTDEKCRNVKTVQDTDKTFRKIWSVSDFRFCLLCYQAVSTDNGLLWNAIITRNSKTKHVSSVVRCTTVDRWRIDRWHLISCGPPPRCLSSILSPLNDWTRENSWMMRVIWKTSVKHQWETNARPLNGQVRFFALR